MKRNVISAVAMALTLSMLTPYPLSAIAGEIESKAIVSEVRSSENNSIEYELKFEDLPMSGYVAVKVELEIDTAKIRKVTGTNRVLNSGVTELSTTFIPSDELKGLSGWEFVTVASGERSVILMGYAKGSSGSQINSSTLDVGKFRFSRLSSEVDTSNAVRVRDVRFYKDTELAIDAEDFITPRNIEMPSITVSMQGRLEVEVEVDVPARRSGFIYSLPFRVDVVPSTEFIKDINDLYMQTKDDESTLKDIGESSFRESILIMNKTGIIAGYPNGNFMPEQQISRAELATLLVRTFAITGNTEMVADDYARHWAREHISILRDLSVMNGYPDGTFQPDASISRAEAVTLVKGLLNIDEEISLTNEFEDTQTSWANENISYMTNKELIGGRTNTTFEPNSPMTRAEAADLLLRTLRLHVDTQLY